MREDATATNARDRVFGPVLDSDALLEIDRLVRSGAREVVASGLSGSARALLVAALAHRLQKPIVVVLRSNREAEDFLSDLEFFSDALGLANGIVTVPAIETDPYDGTSPHGEVLEQRVLSMYRADRGEARIVLIPAAALAARTVSPEMLRGSCLSLRPGEEMPPELIVDLLLSGGYVRQDPVGSVGEFSLRGGILDIFSPANDAPHRIEFFGDTVDSIREFDADTQRSIGHISESVILPLRELAIRREDFMHWAETASVHWSDDSYRLDLRSTLAHAERGEPFPGWEYLLPLTRPLSASAFDYFPNAVFIIDEPAEIETSIRNLYAGLERRFAEADDGGAAVLAPERLFLPENELRSKFQSVTRVDLRLLGGEAAAVDEQFKIEALAGLDTPPDSAEFEEARPTTASPVSFLFPITAATPDLAMNSRPATRYAGRIPDLARDLESKSALLVLPSLGLAERVVEILGEQDVTCRLIQDFLTPEDQWPQAIATVGRLSNGFELPAAGLTVLVERDLFGDTERPATQRQIAARARRQRKTSAFLSDLGDLRVGDYVVHVDHGIGQFQGLTQMTTAGGPTGNIAAGLERGESHDREFMLLTFSEGARLYVPVERLDLVQRYSASEGHRPQLDRLGGAGWQRTKARAKRAMRDMAEELLKLYAERRLVSGHSFGEDSPWQREFEDAFEYQLTSDQVSTIEDIKNDMESAQPMDRLIVGDVGYGKTEVAMRAAFKAVMEGKQVAILAPTTVLVYQHLKTLQSRFGAFPVRVEMLSRFRTAKEQKEVVRAIEAGSVDIVVGTHRLLSKDIAFKDLGLLIVDEEQRFGVAHKERIKQMRRRVDVISMSATPIPRTLNMSLAGLRDMSVIESPPRDRLAIQTHVVQFSESVIRSAVELELQRGGQVFFVHNRVETIFAIGELLSRLVPKARVGVGHGQMSEKDLEDVMLRFIRGELDVLVSTTIIENGIDIPLANTIVINRADAYGLSQLYQLRGRVGRSNRRAYAYLLIPSEESLTQVARRRLAAIREFSDLGAGFRIAALDLELRGAGNLLGGEQSGHIDAIGFDLYTRMLERTVRELKGEEVEDEVSAAINLGIDIRIPEHYIFDVSQRLRTYKRISSAETEDRLEAVHAEIQDRYGPIPETVENLFEYSRLRREASPFGIVSIDREGDRLAIKFREGAKVDPRKLVELLSEIGAGLTPGGVLKTGLESDDTAEIIDSVRGLIDRLRGETGNSAGEL